MERPAVIASIAEARSHGDLKENAEYAAAREKQGILEARIAELEDKLSRSEVIDMRRSPDPLDTVRFGAWVNLQDEIAGTNHCYRIVGDLEADIKKNRLSVSSPMARALLGKRVDDHIELQVPKGKKEYTIVEILYDPPPGLDA